MDYKVKTKELWDKGKTQVASYLQHSTPREHMFILAGIAAMLLVVLAWGYGQVYEVFAAQALEIARVDRDKEEFSQVLEQYLRAKRRRDEIQNQYKEVEIEEGALSHISTLIKSKTGIDDRAITIRPYQAKPFASGYEQLPFLIKFDLSNVKSLVDFLKELIEGKRPMIVSRLDLTRNRNNNQITVEMEVSSIRHLNQ